MKHYFLVSKNVGDLTRILCAALEEQQAKAAPGLTKRVISRFTKRLHKIPGTLDFVEDRGRITLADSDVFKRDPVNIIRFFHLSDINELELHPDALKRMNRSLALIDNDVRENEEANRLFLSHAHLAARPGADAEADERGGCARTLHSGIRQGRRDDAVQHVSSLYRRRAPDPVCRGAGRARPGPGGRDPSAVPQADAGHRGAHRALRRRPHPRHRQGSPGGSLDRRRPHRAKTLPASRPQCQADRTGRLADRGTPDHVDDGADPRPARPQDDHRLCREGAVDGPPEAAGWC